MKENFKKLFIGTAISLMATQAPLYASESEESEDGSPYYLSYNLCRTPSEISLLCQLDSTPLKENESVKERITKKLNQLIDYRTKYRDAESKAHDFRVELSRVKLQLEDANEELTEANEALTEANKLISNSESLHNEVQTRAGELQDQLNIANAEIAYLQEQLRIAHEQASAARRFSILPPSAARSSIPPQTSEGLPDDFDAEGYLRFNQDIRDAYDKVRSRFPTIQEWAAHHYTNHGQAKRRPYK